jgi:biopolymer transport protein ExbB
MSTRSPVHHGLMLLILLASPAARAADTEGTALQIDWFVEMTKGGWTGIALFLLASVAVTLVIERLIRLRPGTLAPDALAEKAKPLWHAHRWDDLSALCRKHPSALARMIQFLVDHRDAPAELLIQGASDIADRAILDQQKRAHALAVIAGLAPLLGLLGTIVGMIESFKLVEIYGDDGGATVLAGSISKALITTALGLVIAIPSMAFYHIFRYKTQALGTLLDEQMENLINAWLLKTMSVPGPSSASEHPDGSVAASAPGTALTFYCRECRQKLQAEADMAGSVIACPRCAASIRIPATTPAG